MIVRPFLLSMAVAFTTSGCGREADTGDDHGHDHAAQTQGPAGEGQPAAAAAQVPVTEAVYGDEAPVELVPVAPISDHGHRHNADGSHPGDDGHDHPQHDHDHDDGDEGHDDDERDHGHDDSDDRHDH